MSLPKLKYPTFTVKVPSTGEELEYHPFLSSEEKILLTGKESGEAADIVRSIVNVINNCVLNDEFDINKYTTFDMEYVFLKMRSKSIGNIVKFVITDDEDREDYTLTVDLESVEMDSEPSQDRKIEFQDGIGVIVNYPTPDIVDKIGDVENQVEATDKMILECIDKVYDSENVYPWANESKEDREAFLDNLSVPHKKKLREFFNTTPKLHFEAKYLNSLGKEKSVYFSTLNDFFTLY